MNDANSKMKQAIIRSAVGDMTITGTDQAQKQFCFKPDFIGFKGHFPGYPLLPAFVQIMTGIVLVEEQIKTSLTLKGVSNAKFLLQIRPDQALTVECKDLSSGGKPGSAVKILTSQGLAASFRIGFKTEGEPGHAE